MEDSQSDPGRTESPSRRSFLVTTGVAAGSVVALAGCLGNDDDAGGDGAGNGDGNSDGATTEPDDEQGYGPWGDPLSSTAVAWDDLGDLEGELVVYSGRTRDQIDPVFEMLEAEYPDFSIIREYNDNAAHLNALREEGDASPADVFYTQSSGALAALKRDGLARQLPDDISEAIDTNYSDPDGMWTGVSGRVRAVQFNTNEFSRDELPTDIFAYAENDRFTDIISTRPNSGTFRSFIVAMMELEGEGRTREWVSKMVNERNVTLYSSGSQQAEEVANGEQAIALGNQYYAGRIIENDPDAPIDVTFTDGDAGALFNVSGIGILDAADNANLAAEFTRHVLAAEGQNFFVEVNGEYPVVDGVEYVGDLPTLDEINPPEFDLNNLADVEAAVDLLRDEGMTV